MILEKSFPFLTISTCNEIYQDHGSTSPDWDFWEYLEEVERLINPDDSDCIDEK